MSRKLRVFISSTMRDLMNERDAVCHKLNGFNFEPVNAEDMLSDGRSSWEKLSSEINTCDIFILILGDRYGWIPDNGSKSEERVSITHLEFKQAISLNIPILTFLKELPYDAERDSEDAKKRDSFREEVRSWEKGKFISNFKLASDLADSVGRAIILMLSDEFQNGKIRKRAEELHEVANKSKMEPLSSKEPSIIIPYDLLNKIINNDVVLFAGAGISVSTGLPSAAAFSEKLVQDIRMNYPEYNINSAGSVFAGIATDFEVIRGRKSLNEAISSMIHPPQGVEPSTAHMNAVSLFEQIITTNYDTLFEEAAKLLNIQSRIIYNETNSYGIPAGKVIIKLHGTNDYPDSLLLTEEDILFLEETRKNLWNTLVNLLNKKTILVVGSSLRDPSIIRLLRETNNVSGYFVNPEIYEHTKGLTSKWNLKCIKSDADNFFKTLASTLLS